jgi:hypothetical protein
MFRACPGYIRRTCLEWHSYAQMGVLAEVSYLPEPPCPRKQECGVRNRAWTK